MKNEITPKQQERLDEFDRKVRELLQSDYENETIVTFGYRHFDEQEEEIITTTDWAEVRKHVLESMQIAVQEVKEALLTDASIKGEEYKKIITIINSLTTEE